MQFDWFTLVAEIVNFLILVALLKYFLYDRIIQVADEREAKVQARFAEAEEKLDQAEEKTQRYEAKQRQLESKRADLITQAEEEATRRRESLLDEARQAVEATQKQWYESLRREQDSFLETLHHRAGEEVMTVARRALQDLADAHLEQQIVETFAARLKELPDDEKKAIVDSLAQSNQQVTIYHAFHLSDEQRQRVLGAVRETFAQEIDGAFKQDSTVIGGLEFQTDGHKVAWSLNSYLADLTEDLSQTLEEELRQQRADRQTTTAAEAEKGAAAASDQETQDERNGDAQTADETERESKIEAEKQ